jgi:hypothetical protein
MAAGLSWQSFQELEIVSIGGQKKFVGQGLKDGQRLL